METQSGQIVIYGQPGHAEVIGLAGQTTDKAIVVTTEEDLDKIDLPARYAVQPDHQKHQRLLPDEGTD